MTDQSLEQAVVAEVKKTFEQLSQEYTMICAKIGDIIFKIKLLEKELKDLHAKADEVNQLAVAAKLAPKAAEPEAAAPQA